MDAEAYADMLPWLVFLVIDRRAGLSVAWAAGCATGCSVGLAAWSYWRGRRAPFPLVALTIFVPCYVAALVFPVWNGAIGVSRSMAVLAVSVSAFTSLRFTPVSEAYTTPLVAPDVLLLPRFRQVNVEMTAAWGVGSLLVSVVGAVATLVRGTFAFTFMDWVVPLVIAVSTVLWATRRWELFRLGLDSGAVRLGTRPDEMDAAEHEVAEAAQGRGAEAVIRELSVGRAQRAARRTTLWREAHD